MKLVILRMLTQEPGAGVVVAVGELVKDIKIGDHAGIKWLNGSCGACDFCKSFRAQRKNRFSFLLLLQVLTSFALSQAWLVTSLSAKMPYYLATQSMVPSSNTASARPPMLPESLRKSHSTLSPRSSVPVSLYVSLASRKQLHWLT